MQEKLARVSIIKPKGLDVNSPGEKLGLAAYMGLVTPIIGEVLLKLVCINRQEPDTYGL